MKTRRNRSAPPPPSGWSSLPDEVACAVLALSSADGFGNAGSVCKRFGRLVSTGAVTVARSRSQTRHTWLVCVGGCGRDDAQPIMTGDTVAAGWYENARDRVYARAGCATEVGKDCLEIEAGLGLTEGDWRVLPRLRTGRAYAGIACVGDAHFLAVGGEGRTGLLRSAELLREGRAAPKALPSLRDGRRDPIVAVLTRREPYTAMPSQGWGLFQWEKFSIFVKLPGSHFLVQLQTCCVAEDYFTVPFTFCDWDFCAVRARRSRSRRRACRATTR